MEGDSDKSQAVRKGGAAHCGQIIPAFVQYISLPGLSTVGCDPDALSQYLKKPVSIFNPHF